MTVPLILLGIASAIGGIVLNNWIGGWLDPAVGGGVPEEAAPSLLHFSTVGLLTLVVVAIGVAISVWVFGPRRDIPVTQPESRSFFTVAGRNDLYGDAFNEAVFMRPGQRAYRRARHSRRQRHRWHRERYGRCHRQDVISAAPRTEWIRPLHTRSTMTLGAAIVGVVIVLGRLG